MGINEQKAIDLLDADKAITEDDLTDINLCFVSDETLSAMLREAIGYAEDLILFEFESRLD